MHRTGYYGVSLLLYAPLGFVVAALGYDHLALLGGVATVGLALVPDYDDRLPLVDHRGPTHTLLFAVLVGTGLGATSAMATRRAAGVESLALVLFAFTVGVLAVVAHLVCDLLTPAGIAPFWPVSDRRFSVSTTRTAHPVANHGLLALGLVSIVAVVVVTSQGMG